MTKSVVRAGLLVDVRNELLLEDRAILVDDGVISGVPAWDDALCTGRTVLDLSGHVVLPGLIDLHTHLVGQVDGLGTSFLYSSAARDALLGAENALKTLRAGFTTVRDVGCYRAFVDCDLRDAINEQRIPGPRIHGAGAFVTSSHGGGELTDLSAEIPLPENFRFGVADSPEEVRRAVRKILRKGANLIKIMATGAVFTPGTVPGAPEYTQEALAAAVDEAAAFGAYVAAHAHGKEGVLRAVRAGVRSIEHGTLIDEETLSIMKEHGTYYVPTTDIICRHIAKNPADTSPRGQTMRQLDSSATAALQLAIKMKIPIGYGTDSGAPSHGTNARQLGQFVANGMTPIQAVRTATLTAAECLGSADVGAVEAGRFADLVAVRGTDFRDVDALRSVDVVIKGGVLVP